MMFPYHYLPAHTYTMFITTYLYQLKSQCMRVEAEEGVMLQEKWKVVIICFLCKIIKQYHWWTTEKVFI